MARSRKVCGLKDDEYLWKGRIYTLPKHGFARFRNFSAELRAVDSAALLFRRNKWLLAHEGNTALIVRSARAGVFGENQTVKGI